MIEILKTDSSGSVVRRIVLTSDEVNSILFAFDDLILFGIKYEELFSLRSKLFDIL